MIVSIYCTERLKLYFSEKQKMERLRQDLISQSKLIKSSSQTGISSSATRFQKIVKFAIRGGSEELLFRNAQQIQKFIIFLLTALHKKVTDKKILNLIIFSARLYLELILKLCQIHVKYYVNALTGQLIILTVVAGGTSGFIISWIGAGATLFANFLGAVFLSRSLGQQRIHNIEYRRFPNHMIKSRKGDKFQKPKIGLAEQIPNNNQNLQLNWEQNPAIKEAVERLGIFEENPNPRFIENSLYNRHNRHLKRLQKARKKLINFKADSHIVDIDFLDK